MAERIYIRWNKHQRLQHLLLMISVTVLVLTGMPLKFPEARMSGWAMRIVGGPETAGVVHRTAAILLALTAAYHLWYLIRAWRRQGSSTSMWPRWQDVRDLGQMLRYFVGLSPRPPRFDRYSYTEKFEYWAVVWGTLIMLVTGFMLWFPVGTARVFSVVILHIAQVIHGYEALLAALSLIIWHFYHAHLNPDVFPMNKVWLTGRITEQELRHHHPLEYERLQAPAQEPGQGTGRPGDQETGEPRDDEDSVAPGGDVDGVVDKRFLYRAADVPGESGALDGDAPAPPCEASGEGLPEDPGEGLDHDGGGSALPEQESSASEGGAGAASRTDLL